MFESIIKWHGRANKIELKQARVRKSYSKIDMANMLNVSLRSYQRYESGHDVIPDIRVRQICNILNCKPEEILAHA